MKKKIVMTLLALSLTMTFSVSAFAGTLSINFNGVNRIFNEATNKDGVTVVDGDALCDALNISYDFDKMTGVITIRDKENTLVMKVKDNNATLNGEKIVLDTAPTKTENGTLLLPFRFIAETFGSDVSYDNLTKSIVVKNSARYYTNFGTLDDVSETTKVYTYDEALKRAKQGNISLKKTINQYDAIEKNLSEVNNSLMTTNAYAIRTNSDGKDTYTIGNPAVSQLLVSKNSLSDTLDLKDDSVAATESAIELSLISSLNALENAKTTYLLTKNSLDIQKQNLDNTRLKNSLGLVSDADLKNAENNYSKALINLSLLDEQINVAKQNINSVMGLPLTADTYVSYDTTIEPKTFDVEKVVTNAKLNSITIKQAEIGVKQAEDAFNYIDTTFSYETKMRDLNSAELQLADAKNTVEKNVRSTYQTYNQLAENDKSLKASRTDAINKYNVAFSNYNAGNITKLDLDSAKLNIANFDAQILQNELSYKTISYQLSHPELF